MAVCGKRHRKRALTKASSTQSESLNFRKDLSEIPEEELLDFTFEQTSAGYKSSETHGGDDVAIFAQGEDHIDL